MFPSHDQRFEVAVDQAINASEKTIRAAAITVFTDVIKKTPVGNTSLWKTSYPPKGYVGGQLRGNWQTTLDVPASNAISRSQKGTSGGATQETISGSSGYSLDQSIFLTNNLPYAERINDGWSRQAPAKFVETSVLRFNGIVEAIARKNKT